MKKQINWPVSKALLLLGGAFFLGLATRWPLMAIVGISFNFIANFLIDDLPEENSITSNSDADNLTQP
jgi:hypothetical protein